MSALAKSIQICEQLRNGLAYSESDYVTFCAHYKTTTKAEQVAYFGSLAYEQMERRYDSQLCSRCDELCAEEDLPPYGEPVICYRCQCKRRFAQGGRDDPDGYNDVPRGEQE